VARGARRAGRRDAGERYTLPWKPLRTAAEEAVGRNIERIFAESPASVESKLENFPVYARRKSVTRFLALYEVFKLALPVKGSVVECGVNRGFGLMSWAKFSAVIEPANLSRRIYGFDSFEGFPAIHRLDRNPYASPARGGLSASSFDEIERLVAEFDRDRFLGHIAKIKLVAGDARRTIPEFVRRNRHLVVSLLFMDFDLFEPTRVALEHFVPRMPRGAVLAFDELDNPIWPGETAALLESLGIQRLRIQRLPWDPYIGFAVIE
jgi:hypothetical protein